MSENQLKPTGKESPAIAVLTIGASLQRFRRLLAPGCGSTASMTKPIGEVPNAAPERSFGSADAPTSESACVMHRHMPSSVAPLMHSTPPMNASQRDLRTVHTKWVKEVTLLTQAAVTGAPPPEALLVTAIASLSRPPARHQFAVIRFGVLPGTSLSQHSPRQPRLTVWTRGHAGPTSSSDPPSAHFAHRRFE